ncbi:MAG: RNA polymerase factor sigma-54 [Thiomonas delicata]
MKQTLNLRLSQHLALTPQLQQSIRLLQLSTLELQQEVEQMLEANPFLEHEEAEPEPEAASEAQATAEVAEARKEAASDETPELKLDREDWQGGAEQGDWDAAPGETWQGSSSEADDDFDPLGLAHVGIDLRAHLRSQLAGLSLGEGDRAAAEAIIDSLDDDGYLPEGPDQLAAELDATADAEEREALCDALRMGLKLVQSFDPAGVGATTLSECLCLQLRREPPCPIRDLAMALCAGGHMDLLSKRDWRRLGRLLHADEAALREVQQRIAKLDPRPGARFAPSTAQAVTPDVIAQRSGRRWRAVLNPEVLPKLRINGLYADLLRRSRDGAGLSGQLQEARWFVRNVQQRFETIERVAQAVIERQQNFFNHGELGMRPLVLREIADELGLHESTISRVTTQKYVLTPFGTFELKYFFGSGLSTDTGGNASSTAVRALIRQMVQEENPAAPLSDGEIAERLSAQGITVARRTVAKYRDALRIPPTAQRKSA